MGYASLRHTIADLERTGQLVRIDTEIDPYLEAAAIQRRVYAAGGPAILYARVKGCRFPMVSNLFGTLERTRFLFRDMLRAVEHLVELKVDPARFWKAPWRFRDVPRTLWQLRPRFVRTGPILDRTADDPRPAAAGVLAARRRAVHHAAGGVYRGCGPAGLAALEPRHVSRAALRQPVQAGPRGRPALPDPPRYRRPSCGGAAARHAVSREHLRRRPAGADACRRHAAARGPARIGVRRGAGRPARATRSRSPTVCRSPPTPTSASPARSIRSVSCPRARSATISVTTAWPIRSRC